MTTTALSEPTTVAGTASIAEATAPHGWLGMLEDNDLLRAVEAAQRRANEADGLRLAGVVAFYERRAGDHEARRAADPHFTMTPLSETAVEVAPLLGATEGRVRQEVRSARYLIAHFPRVWGLVLSGQLDMFRARLISDAAETQLSDAEALEKFSEAISSWLLRHLDALRKAREGTDEPGAGPPLVMKTCRQIGNRVNYLIKKLRSGDAEERHRRGFERRGVHTSSTGDGLGELSLSHDAVSLKAVDYRLLLMAKAMRREGDPRTLEQLRADLAVDLLLGRLTLGASTGEFEDPDTSPTGDPLDSVTQWPTQRWARPVINVTVPIQTLMGLSDSPGVLSGGEPVPAGLVRRLAQDPDSTWYRMLTDPARECVELSTKSYKPTGPIWRQVVGSANTCFGPVCTMPATECELDHRTSWPRGATSTDNLGPGCNGHHKAKHAPGFGLSRSTDGVIFRTGSGLAHPVENAEQPVDDRWGVGEIWDFEFSVAEIREALQFLAHERRQTDDAFASRREIEQQKADYRASYPDATEEEIDGWVHDDDPQAPTPPPILRKGLTLGAVLAREAAAKQRYSFWDDPEAYEEIA
ncbi:MAG TPA: DUF222 domain-containing protein [Nocardioidaceae bacterium]